MQYIEGQFTKEEREAYLNFKEFAKHNPKIYSDFAPTKYGTRHDVDCYNVTGGTETVELKLRASNADKYKDCFIEPRKLDYLVWNWETNSYMPIYINFIGDWKNVYVWYIPQIRYKKFYKNVPILQGDGNISYEDRYGLSWQEAYHYVWDEAIQAYTMTPPKKKIAFNKKVHNKPDLNKEEINEIRLYREKQLGL